MPGGEVVVAGEKVWLIRFPESRDHINVQGVCTMHVIGTCVHVIKMSICACNKKHFMHGKT